VNGKTVNKPGIMVRPGDVITLRKRPNIEKLYKHVGEGLTVPPCDWINYDQSTLSAIVTTLPSYSDVGLVVDVNQVVAFLSR
jgi:small subunit ribosomal protein S4